VPLIISRFPGAVRNLDGTNHQAGRKIARFHLELHEAGEVPGGLQRSVDQYTATDVGRPTAVFNLLYAAQDLRADLHHGEPGAIELGNAASR
jgi:hypothetical protein